MSDQVKSSSELGPETLKPNPLFELVKNLNRQVTGEDEGAAEDIEYRLTGFDHVSNKRVQLHVALMPYVNSDAVESRPVFGLDIITGPIPRSYEYRVREEREGEFIVTPKHTLTISPEVGYPAKPDDYKALNFDQNLQLTERVKDIINQSEYVKTWSSEPPEEYDNVFRPTKL